MGVAMTEKLKRFVYQSAAVQRRIIAALGHPIDLKDYPLWQWYTSPEWTAEKAALLILAERSIPRKREPVPSRVAV